LYFYLMTRFILDKSRPADFNMAADLYLLERGTGVAVRFYSWARPSITLGYMQAAGRELNLEAVRAGGAGWVRRPTGGRAILHDGDLTYSCAFHRSLKEMGGSIAETYRLISKCLMDGLDRASIKCIAHDSDGGLKGIGREVKLPCFLAPNRDEIMVSGKKLVGSAQKRTAGAVLQHGSIPITNAFRQLPRYLRIDDAERDRQINLLIEKSCCVDELVPGATFESLAACLMEGFSAVLPFEFEVMPWTEREEEDINNIVQSDEFITRYKSDASMVILPAP